MLIQIICGMHKAVHKITGSGVITGLGSDFCDMSYFSYHFYYFFSPLDVSDIKVSQPYIFFFICYYIFQSRFLLDALHIRSKFANFCHDLMQNHLS